MSSSGFEVLDACAHAIGVELDPVEARHALAMAHEEIAGAEADVWRERLAQAGGDVGLRVQAANLPLADAFRLVSATLPVVCHVADGNGSGEGRWVVLTGRHLGRIRVAGLRPGELDRWVSRRELARLLGHHDSKLKLRCALIQPLAPCEPVRDPLLAAGHGHGHGSGPGHGHDFQHHLSPLQRLLRLIRPEWRDIWVIVLFAVVVGVLSLATPLAVEALVTTVALNLLVHQLLVLALVLLVCLGFAAAIRGLQTFVVEIIQRRLFARVAADMAYRLPRVRVDAYDQQYGPDLVNRFFDVLTVQKVGASLLLDGIAVVLQAVIGLLVLAFYHPFLLGFDLIVLGTISFVIFLLGRGAVRTSIRESLAKYDLVARLENIARAPIAYKFPYGHELAMDQGDALTRGYLAARQAHFRILMRQILFALGFQAIASAALLGLGGWLVIQQELTLGQLVAAELIVAVVIGGFAKLGKHLEGWYDLMAAMDKLGHLIDLRLERNDGEPLGETAYSSTEGASLTLHHLSYAYDGYHHEVLQGLDLEIAPGERVAIIGPSGSGKSTLADLIFGLRAPTHGDIELDGVNIRDLRLNSLREQVSLVKEPEVIEGTILENVWLGRHHIPLTEVRAALEAVGLKQELAHLPAGLHTRLTSQGAPLSLGQLRRLMLARAIVGKPRLLVLDEALDGLDLDSRRRVMNALFDRSAPWTLLVITHDQEVASECDRAVALAEGRADHTIPLANGHSPRLEDWLKELRR